MTKGKDVRIYKSYKKIVRRYNRDSGYIEFYEEEDRWDFPFIRRKNGYAKLKKNNVTCKEFGVKSVPNEDVSKYDPYNDDRARAYAEAKSWKRNSKRKHQWKEL